MKPHASTRVFKDVVLNNLGVILKVILISLFFGTGGLFLALYTASSFSLFITTFIMSKKELLLSTKGLLFLAFLSSLSLPHTFLEIISFFVAGLASVKMVYEMLSHPLARIEALEKTLQ